MEDAGGDSSGGGYGGMTVEACEGMIRKSLKLPMVKFLREKMEEAGCPVKERFFKATVCTDKVSGGYMTGKGVVVCSNHLTFQDEVNQVIIHELIHAYDDCRAANLNWTNCAHHACSEIRAAHLSGDCHFKRELLRGHTKLRGHEQECVKRRVQMSLANNPYCSGPSTAKNAMEAVWEICYNDTKPFDRAP
ncbi:unnamed protein product [Spirodela intermedia]|uniref:Mitochondrial inner membrane protease ATP23 n=2 Tax=Spirodela intermedia TaxID=51605 RepID=A0A7I8IPA8_SPIIN|nr:unnamed protein product [Spirodela intermedia]CAA6659610.1 unnamed protein product [Spirodela intermedia]CAA7395928.1 unnamed protein product [Spirodela intermedia]